MLEQYLWINIIKTLIYIAARSVLLATLFSSFSNAASDQQTINAIIANQSADVAELNEGAKQVNSGGKSQTDEEPKPIEQVKAVDKTKRIDELKRFDNDKAITSSKVESAEKKKAELIILIDDMGHSLSLNQAALNLPGPVSFAFLPFAHFSQRLAKEAHERQKDVLLHAPMQSIYNHALGKGGMTESMDELAFKQTLRKNIAAIPHLVGVNNHMGSKLTSLSLQMQWTMQVVKEHDLFFVDSRTTGKSVAWQEAKKQGVSSLRRDIFLDHVISWEAMSLQYKKALAIARKHGSVLVIAHPHALTIKFLKAKLPQLAQENVKLVPLSTQLGSQFKSSSVVLNTQ